MQTGDVVITPNGPAAIIDTGNKGNLCLYFFRKQSVVPDHRHNSGFTPASFKKCHDEYGWWIYAKTYPIEPLEDVDSLTEQERLRIIRWKMFGDWKANLRD